MNEPFFGGVAQRLEKDSQGSFKDWRTCPYIYMYVSLKAFEELSRDSNFVAFLYVAMSLLRKPVSIPSPQEPARLISCSQDDTIC